MDGVVAVVTDLFFQARISAAARAAGRAVQFVSATERLHGLRPAVALVDLDADLDVSDVIRRLKDSGASVIAFGPHLDTESRKEARGAGADRVLAKSKFVTELPNIMQANTLRAEFDRDRPAEA